MSSPPSFIAMYRKDSSARLPHWQHKPAHRRTPLSRRNRFLIVIALVLVAWYHYSGSPSPPSPPGLDDAREAIASKDIPKTYPQLRPEQQQRVVAPHGGSNIAEVNPKPPKALTENRVEVRKPATVIQERDTELSQRPATNTHSEKSEGSKNSEKSEKSEESEKSDASDQHEVAPPKQLTPDFTDDETAPKQAILDGRRKPEGAAGNGASESIDHAPPPLVKEASEKIVEQHLAPAAKYEEEEIKAPKEPQKGPQKFPAYSEYAELGDKAEALPDIVHITFEDSTADVILEGWEDQWFSEAKLDIPKWGKIKETKIDFVYTWVNGSDTAFQETIYPYEVNSTLNDEQGKWLESHRVNRYRDWDELRYSIRSVEKYASGFRNKIQLLVNAVADPNEALKATVDKPATIIAKQRPLWLKNDKHTRDTVQILSQEDFFDESEQGCLPTFNSLTIENQIFNTKSDTDRFFALSDDMLLGKPHAASDIYSPLFGPSMGFKSNSYNTVNPPTDLDARRFGEKPFLIYTSWLLNRRFGERKRKGQIHFGHSMSRSVTREAIKSFPRPALQSACQRFRGETGFQLYSWYVAFHYTIERHREALLWSYIMVRSDADRNGNLGWAERQVIMEDLEEGMSKEGETGFRKRMFYHMNEHLEDAGLEPPKVNIDVQWTSLDGPAAIKDIECFEFNVNECLAPGFSTPSSDEIHTNHVFSSASIFDRVTRQHPKCGDCLLKLILNRAEKGLAPLLPHAATQAEERKTVLRALWKYQYTIVDPDAFFVMITDAEQVENVLLKRLLKKKGKVGQLCLNDDVNTDEEGAVADVRNVMIRLLEGMVSEPSAFEDTPAAVAAPRS